MLSYRKNKHSNHAKLLKFSLFIDYQLEYDAYKKVLNQLFSYFLVPFWYLGHVLSNYQIFEQFEDKITYYEKYVLGLASNPDSRLKTQYKNIESFGRKHVRFLEFSKKNMANITPKEIWVVVWSQVDLENCKNHIGVKRLVWRNRKKHKPV